METYSEIFSNQKTFEEDLWSCVVPDPTDARMNQESAVHQLFEPAMYVL